ncbi:MAG: YkgJ family cysteine cluster protein [Proteobacteria bacterium]|nr:YkgJ family cysteine cluster protein [Pseudomonadota bacterium]
MTGPSGPVPGDGPFKPLEGRSFRFACHPGISCFTACCADLKLVLTPYDVLRLKNRLNLSSDRFLETYTTMETGPGERFPMVLLKMTEKAGRPCPFVSPQGCTLYEDRPGACRIYPLGRGSARGGRETYFLVQEAHCLGFEEEKTWQVEDWLADQGLEAYHEFNDLWMEILTNRASLGPATHAVKKVQMFSMVSYNLDRFRQFVFGSRFLDMFDLDQGMLDQARADDPVLLRLGFQWLRFALFGEQTLPLKPGLEKRA